MCRFVCTHSKFWGANTAILAKGSTLTLTKIIWHRGQNIGFISQHVNITKTLKMAWNVYFLYRIFILAVSSSSAVIFVVKGVEDSENKAELLNSLSRQINSGSVVIQFKEARKGSTIVYTNIYNSVLKNGRNFARELSIFMELVFITVKLKKDTDKTL